LTWERPGTLLVGPGVTGLSEATHLKDVYAEGLEPGQQPLQSRKIGEFAVQDGLDWLYGCAEVLEVE